MLRILFIVLLLPFTASASPLVDAAKQGMQEGLEATLGGLGSPFTGELYSSTARWEVISARPRKECLLEASGYLDDRYKRCRFGYEEFVKYSVTGERVVLQRRELTQY